MAAPAPLTSPPTQKTVFLCGCVGSVMPYVVNFTQLAIKGGALPVTNWKLVAILGLAYALCAGLFARWWRPENEFKAVWIGISFATIVTGLVQTAPKGP
jgi:hypothetical protein